MNWGVYILDMLTVAPELAVWSLFAAHCVQLRRPALFFAASLAATFGLDLVVDLLTAARGAAYPTFFHFLLSTGIYFALLCAFSRARPIHKIFCLAVNLLNTVLCEMPCALLWLAITEADHGISSMEAMLADRPTFLLLRALYLFLYATLTLITARLWDMVLKRAGETILLWFIPFPLVQWFTFAALYIRAVKDGSWEDISLVCCVSAFVFLLADGLMYFAIRQLGQKQILEQKNALLEEQLSLLLAHYQYILDDMAHVSNMRHDLASQLQTVYALLDMGRETEARALLQGFAGGLTRLQGGFCENKIVDAVMAEKSRECREKGIALKAALEVPEELPFEGVELCGLFANILDNAIKAAAETPEPAIRLRAGQNGGFFILRAENSAPEKAAEKAVKGTPGRGLWAEHGRGLGIITMIAEKYGGAVKTETPPGAFRITVWLKPD